MIALRAPIVLALLALLAGLVPALRFPPPPFPLLLLAVVLLMAAIPRETRRSDDAPRNLFLLAAFAAAGAALGGTTHAVRLADCRLHLSDGAAVAIEGRLAGGWDPARIGERAPPLLHLDRGVVRSDGECRGSLRVALPAGTAALRAGSVLRGEGQWVRSRGAHLAGPWPPDPLRSGFVRLDLVEARAPLPRESPLLALRADSEARVDRLFGGSAPLVHALLLGRREGLDPAVRDGFARAGLAHLLAISGMHVGLLAGALALVGAVARIGRRGIAVLVLGALGGYLLLIGAPVPALRAGIMIGLATVGLLLQRPFLPVALVATAALALVVAHPGAVVEPGFQLSFIGVVGILVVRHAVLARIPERWLGESARRVTIEALVISGGAFLATAPVAAYHFGLVAPISPVSNLPAMPLLSLALIGVSVAMLLDPILPGLALFLAGGAELCLALLGRWAALMAAVPGGHLYAGRQDVLLWLGAAAAAFAGVHAVPRVRAPVRGAVALTAALAVLLAAPVLGAARSPGLELHFLDVGQGDATAVRTPGNRWLLIDAGPRTDRHDAGEQRVLPYLRRRGVRRLEALILTHPHADHIGGAAAVVRGLGVERIIDPAHPHGTPPYLELLDEAERRQVPWLVARAGHTAQVDGVEVNLLWPDPDAVDGVRDVNEISVVVHLRYGDFAALLTGDAYLAQEEILVGRHGRELRSDVLQAGHHGSRTSTGEGFLAAVGPTLVVFSAAARSRFGHPAAEVVARARAAGATTLSTGADGTVVVHVPAPGTRGWRWSTSTRGSAWATARGSRGSPDARLPMVRTRLAHPTGGSR